jgi:hypothetical protein
VIAAETLGIPALVRDRRFALAVIIVGALAIRLAGIGEALNHDEGYTWLVSSASTPDAFLRRLANFENTPGLYYALAAALPQRPEFWLRLPAVLAGAATVPVLYAIVRPLLGTPTALVAAALLAVAPEQVATSDLARGFMLAELGVLLALWAAARLAQGAHHRWWWLWLVGGAVALYSEYNAAVFLTGIALALLVLGRPARRQTLLWSLAPVLVFLPWIPELVRSLDQLHKTKIAPILPRPSLRAFREQLVPVFAGRAGRGVSSSRGDAELLVIVGTLSAAAAGLWRAAAKQGDARLRDAFWLTAGAAAMALITQLLLAGAGGPNFLSSRYLAPLAATAAVLVAWLIASIPVRWVAPVAMCGVVIVGFGVFINRLHASDEPSARGYRSLVAASGARRVLTNSPVIAYYLSRYDPVLNRGLGLGPNLEAACAVSGSLPLAVVDDQQVGAGARQGPGTSESVSHYVVRIVRRREPNLQRRCYSRGL